MEIIYVEDALWENLFLTAVDFVFFIGGNFMCIVGWKKNVNVLWDCCCRFFDFYSDFMLQFVDRESGNDVALWGIFGSVGVFLSTSEKDFLAEEEEKARLLEIEKESKKQAVIKKIADKARGNHLHFMPRVENNDL